MNQLTTEARAKVIGCLVEGCSQRATTRLTGVAKKTVARLAMEMGAACQAFAERALVNLPQRHLAKPRPTQRAIANRLQRLKAEKLVERRISGREKLWRRK